MYLTNCTRSDTTYVVGRLIRYTSNPDHIEYWNALERVFRYLKDPTNYEIHYSRVPTIWEWFSDVN